MAIYYFEVKTFGRSRGKEGSSATSAAAYRAGESIRDERTGRTYDHSQRQDVLHKEIVVPSRFSESDMGWAQDRSTLWNAAEAAEVRKDARVAREYVVALPSELAPELQVALMRRFAQSLSDRYANAVDFAIHAPRPESDPRNFHAHLLTTTREVSPDGIGMKTTLDISSTARHLRGLEPVGNEYLWVRGQWVDFANEALRTAGASARIDSGNYRVDGEGAPRVPRLPKAAIEIERRGERSFVAERIREQWLDRRRGLELTGPSDSPAEHVASAGSPVSAAGALDLEEVRRKARENWMRLRQQASVRSGANAADLSADAAPGGEQTFDKDQSF